ncbi:hypothetical protein SALBM135S_08116 [Streptomyces alboniger]
MGAQDTGRGQAGHLGEDRRVPGPRHRGAAQLRDRLLGGGRDQSSAAVGQEPGHLRQVVAADQVEDGVHAATGHGLAHPLGQAGPARHMHRAERLHELRLGRARRAHHSQPEVARELRRRHADTAPDPGDQQCRPLGQRELAQSVVRGGRRDRQHGSVREGDGVRLERGGLRGEQGVLRVAPGAGGRVAEHRVARREPRHPGADPLHHPRDLAAQDLGARQRPLARPALARPQLPVDRVHARRPHRDEHLPGTRLRYGQFEEGLHLGATVFRVRVRLGHLWLSLTHRGPTGVSGREGRPPGFPRYSPAIGTDMNRSPSRSCPGHRPPTTSPRSRNALYSASTRW